MHILRHIHVHKHTYVYTCTLHILHTALCVHKCVFDALQDLRPLYAGRCDYHSSEAERDVRLASLNSPSRPSRARCQLPV